uniref:Uncharacterized protein n=1 Tax=Romanomermis culicivorax TaxID=13658 RepID=A0A915J449_ROMCU
MTRTRPSKIEVQSYQLRLFVVCLRKSNQLPIFGSRRLKNSKASPDISSTLATYVQGQKLDPRW